MTIWPRLAAFLQEGTRACLITLVRLEGSSPREVGAHMLVRVDGGFTGSIGGGALEWQALALAQQLLAGHPEGKGALRAFSLGPDLGQCCGGRVSLLFEAFALADQPWIAELARGGAEAEFTSLGRVDARGIFLRTRETFPPMGEQGDPWQGAALTLENGMLRERHGDARTPLLLFGAGHVGRALVLALAPLPFAIRWIDSRPEAFPGHHPANTVPVATEDPCRELAAAQPGSLMLAMTHSHALDFQLVAGALRIPAMAFVGVIGSATKRARFASQLRGMGFDEAAVARMICPIGHPALAGKAPAVIAAGVAVQLLEMHERAQRLKFGLMKPVAGPGVEPGTNATSR